MDFLSNYHPTNKPFLCEDAPFPEEVFKNLYPAEKYKLRSFYALHFLVALNQPFQTIESYLFKHPEKILLPDPENFNLTPLHLAAMKANAAVVALFLSIKGKDGLACLTSGGFSPLHFAALTSENVFDLFIQKGGNPADKTKEGADCLTLKKLCGRILETRTTQSLYFQENGSKKPLLLSQNPEVASQIFGSAFFQTDSPLFCPLFFHDLFREKKPTVLSSLFSADYKKFCANPPPLTLVPSANIEHSWELRAKETIKPGIIICELSGQKKKPASLSFTDHFSEKAMIESSYCLNTFDQKIVGNESRFIHAGFPNAYRQNIIENGSKRSIVVATDTIQPGEQILFDYEMDSLPFMFLTQQIIGKERMVAFYKKHKETLIEKLKRFENEQQSLEEASCAFAEDVASWANFKCSFLFPLYNPTALLFLHFHDIYDFSRITQVIETSGIKFLDIVNKKPKFQHIRNIVGILWKLRKNKNKKAISEWVCSLLERSPLVDILKGLDLFAKGKSLSEVNDLLAKGYDWRKDPDHPFSYKRRLDNLREYYKRFPKQKIIELLESALKKIGPNSEDYQMQIELLVYFKGGAQKTMA